MAQRIPKHYQQRGAVAVMSGLLLMLVLIPVSGLVLDLGHLYIVKTELQNMSDSAALAAAKDLDNSDAGLNKAVASGKALALKNRYDFGSTLTLQDANFRFAASPDGPWYTLAQSLGNANGRTFVEVNTKDGGSSGTAQSINTWLMRIAGNNSTSTFGAAVAGRFVNTVTPIGVCAIDPTRRNASYDYGTFTELVEFGFRRGVSYNIFELGSLGGASSDPYQINPVNSPPNTCSSANSSANVTAPFMCVGNSAVLPTGIGQVYTNTGMTSSLDKALNSRFNDYSGGSQCDPASAPPDKNVKEYLPGSGNAPADWQDSGTTTQPTQQSISTSGTPKLPQYSLPHEATASAPTKVWPSTVSTRVTTPTTYPEYGAMWSYTPAVQSDGTTAITPAQANGTIGTNTIGTDKLMYGRKTGTTADYINAATYPTSIGAGFTSDHAAPYNQASGATFLAPAGRPGVEDRRILNIVLIDCRSAPVGSASCGVMTAVGIGKFFMQKKADFSGSPKKLDVEFTGLVQPVPSSEVKLYK
ncbi:Putative Flp pilus-assembly TadE/G-like [Duganella sp. CF458]|uniref:pilus assembly protein TadG-related protein n=1 Tax=Duganella sp. CF458 TaxID=1884368 RepID=UPI0008E20DC1|nr:pilus assembly protein TadG-related protein [Duganella sp. CF458]SFF92697.1 Putative Flp pilus-assembly TadE/G-like [Duganella sp. CF458]